MKGRRGLRGSFVCCKYRLDSKLSVKLTRHISVQVQLSIAGVIAADTSAYKDQVASWDGEKRVVSK